MVARLAAAAATLAAPLAPHLLAAVQPAARTDVESLPGVGKLADVNLSVSAGYLNAGTAPDPSKGTMYFHSYCAGAADLPEDAPLLIWYNGGPGASSLFGMLQVWQEGWSWERSSRIWAPGEPTTSTRSGSARS